MSQQRRWPQWIIPAAWIGICLMALPLSASAEEAAITVESIVVCQDIADREPVGAGGVFPNNVGRLFCLTRILGAPADTEITHKWIFNGEPVASVTLPVRSATWRTYSSKNIMPNWTGDWSVEVIGPSGAVLSSIRFRVE